MHEKYRRTAVQNPTNSEGQLHPRRYNGRENMQDFFTGTVTQI
jgi:hypothetical protein